MDRKLLLSIALSLATVGAMHYFFGKFSQAPEKTGPVSVEQQEQTAVSGQPIKVPTTQDLYKPLVLDVSFAAERKAGLDESNTVVQTDYCTATFSNYGAILTSLDFDQHTGRNKTALKTVQAKGVHDEQQRKKGCFLLALDENTPFIYTLKQRRETDGGMELVFQAENESWVITKEYVFVKDSYQIDVIVGFEPKVVQAKPVKPRLFFVAPFIKEIEQDSLSVVAWNESKQAIDKSEAVKAQGLVWPWQGTDPLFGVENKYFVHALINDPSKFVQRAYVKYLNDREVLPVLEGPEVTEGREWRMSFYFGPKLFQHFAKADARLEELLSFGWLSWLCKLLLQLLEIIYKYVGNFGFAIIILTILLKIPFTPFSIYGRRRMEEYQKHQPIINKIRQKYRNDLKLAHEEIMKYHKDHGLSPTAHMVGCLPLLVQLPILFALYRVLNNYLALHQAPFIGWIVDLSSKDPYYVLPILMGLSMLVQQIIAPVSDEKQRAVMMFMPVIMTVVFLNFPAGLVLYWFVNNVLTVAEDSLRKYIFG
ncbi:MAG: membrane protein insertase YidC [Epsilonproteobacteria bacterium]|nr:membrane protein insertase YidC [Campylobacterota bacterium]